MRVWEPRYAPTRRTSISGPQKEYARRTDRAPTHGTGCVGSVRPDSFNADFRGGRNLPNVHTTIPAASAGGTPATLGSGGLRSQGVKGTQYAPIGPPATARVPSALSTQPPSTGGCGLVCSDRRQPLSP